MTSLSLSPRQCWQWLAYHHQAAEGSLYLMFFSGLPPLAQPFFEGLILALAIAFGSVGVLRVRNKLKLFAQ